VFKPLATGPSSTSMLLTVAEVLAANVSVVIPCVTARASFAEIRPLAVSVSVAAPLVTARPSSPEQVLPHYLERPQERRLTFPLSQRGTPREK